MKRINSCFTQLKNAGKQALIPYIVAGDPDLKISLALMHALVTNGADIIELGVPFSDPSADGPVIQLASERALINNTSLRNVLELVTDFRQQNTTTPIVLMGYLNPIERMGYQEFIEAAGQAGVDGLLVVDMPPEESHDLFAHLKKSEIDIIFLVAPTTNDTRLNTICQASSGYVYYVSLKGVTGASHLNIDSVAQNLERLRKFTSLPIGVGFGISDASSAAKISEIADAVVVGSVLVNKVAELKTGVQYSLQELVDQLVLMKDMRAAMDAS